VAQCAEQTGAKPGLLFDMTVENPAASPVPVPAESFAVPAAAFPVRRGFLPCYSITGKRADNALDKLAKFQKKRLKTRSKQGEKILFPVLSLLSRRNREKSERYGAVSRRWISP